MKTAKKSEGTPEINEKEADKDMLDLLVTLTETPYWPAIQRYNRQRDMMVLQSLRSIDPFKETTQMARIQGIGIGLYDLENGAIEEKKRRSKESSKNTTDLSAK